MSQYMSGDAEWESGVVCLQQILKEIMALNKALGIDCKQYSENGKPILTETEDGAKSPIEILPNELRIDNSQSN